MPISWLCAGVRKRSLARGLFTWLPEDSNLSVWPQVDSTVRKEVRIWETKQCQGRDRNGEPQRWPRYGLEVRWGHLRQATTGPRSP